MGLGSSVNTTIFFGFLHVFSPLDHFHFLSQAWTFYSSLSSIYLLSPKPFAQCFWGIQSKLAIRMSIFILVLKLSERLGMLVWCNLEIDIRISIVQNVWAIRIWILQLMRAIDFHLDIVILIARFDCTKLTCLDLKFTFFVAFLGTASSITIPILLLHTVQ